MTSVLRVKVGLDRHVRPDVVVAGPVLARDPDVPDAASERPAISPLSALVDGSTSP